MLPLCGYELKHGFKMMYKESLRFVDNMQDISLQVE